MRRRRGFFLVLTLIVIVLSTMAAYSFTDLMMAYDEAAYLNADRGQTEMLVESGVEATRLILSKPAVMRAEMGGVFSNPGLFQAVNVAPGLNVASGMDAAERGNFTILAPALDETGQFSGLRYGLQNESARLNINTLPTLEASGEALTAMTAMAGALMGDADASMDGGTENLARSLLLALPGMNDELADAVLDFIDEDDEPRDFGAESEYYNALPSPYSPKNGPLDSVEELLLVKGMSAQLLFGADSNRNGVIDPGEQQLNAVMAGQDGSLSLGLASFLTVYSLENNKRSDGTPRINANGDDLEILYADLSDALENDDWATFIVAYRIAGKPGAGLAGMASGDDGSGGGGASQDIWTAAAFSKLDMSGGAKTELSQLLDLVGATVQVEGETYASPFLDSPIAMSLYMPKLMGNLTTKDFSTMPGRININECPAALIRGIPMIPPEVADAIIEARGQQSDSENRQFETWPLVEGLVTTDEMKLLMPLVTGGGDVYRAQIVGYFEGKNTSSRSEIIIDATSVNPKVIYWRDLSHLGRGFDKAVLGLRAVDAAQVSIQSASN